MSLQRVWLDRQAGVASAHDLRSCSSGSIAVLQRLELQNRLEGHNGCVNTVHFSPDGNLLVSGSDDQDIRFWDWQAGATVLRWASGHHNNVFQARVMPESHNKTVVSCAADGQVRLAHIPEGGGQVETRRLARHQGRAHKLAIEPGSPSCFYSCGEDGEVRHFDLREPAAGHRRLLVCRASAGRPLELNSIHCNPRQPCQFVVGGADEQCRVYDQRKPSRSSASLLTVAQPVRRLAPRHLHNMASRDALSSVHITCAVFSQQGEILATYNDENIYLFASEQGAWHRPGGGGGASAQRGGPPRRGRAQQDAGKGSTAAAGAAAAAQRGERSGGADSRGSNKRGRSVQGEGREEEEEGREGSTGAARRRGRARNRGGGEGLAGPGPGAGASGGGRGTAVLAASGEGAAAAAAAAAHARVRAGLLRDAEEDVASLSLASSPCRGGPSPAAGPGHAQQQQQQLAMALAGSTVCGPDSAWLDRHMLPAEPAAAQQGAAGHMPFRQPRMEGDGPEAAQPCGQRGRLRMALPPPVHSDACEPLGRPSSGSREQPALAGSTGPAAAGQEGRAQAQGAGEGFIGPPPPSSSEASETEKEGEECGDPSASWRAELLDLTHGGSSGAPSWDRDSEGSESEEGEEDDSGNDADESSSSEESGQSEDEAGEDTEEGEEEEESGSERLGAGAIIGEGEEGVERQGWPGPSFGSLEEEEEEGQHEVAMKYTGHRNSQTVKGVNFMGWCDEWVVSGSDCGHVFFWSKKTGKLATMVKGDRHVVNCLEPHPHHTLTLATSGIEDDIKIWAPTLPEPRQPGAEAEEVMRSNTAHQGRARRRMVITPQLLRMLLGERLEVRRRAAQRGGRGAGAGERGQDGNGDVSGEEGADEDEDGEDDEVEEGSEREWLLHVEGSEEEEGGEALRRIAPGECSVM